MKQLDVWHLTAALGCVLAHKLRASIVFDPERNSLSGLVENRRGQTTSSHSGPKTILARSLRADAAKRCGKMLDTSSCHLKLRGRKHPVGVGRHQVGWPKSPPVSGSLPTCRTLRRNRPSPRSADAIRRKLDGCVATLRSPPIAFSMSMHVGKTEAHLVLPWIQRKSSIQPQDGREASYVTGTCARKAICRPISDLSSSGRFNRRQNPPR